MQKALLALFITVALLPGLHSKAQEGTSTLRKIAEFDLPGPSGKRFDYLTIDPDDHYLISPHLAAGQTYIINVRSKRWWRQSKTRGCGRRHRPGSGSIILPIWFPVTRAECRSGLLEESLRPDRMLAIGE